MKRGEEPDPEVLARLRELLQEIHEQMEGVTEEEVLELLRRSEESFPAASSVSRRK